MLLLCADGPLGFRPGSPLCLRPGQTSCNIEQFGQYPLQVNGFNSLYECLEGAMVEKEIEALPSDRGAAPGREVNLAEGVPLTGGVGADSRSYSPSARLCRDGSRSCRRC